jgi:DNA-directed RNA polymerase subunit M/transcription elongation factor TFIIS
MSVIGIWITDDWCPSCGELLTAYLNGDGTATWHCRTCGRETTWNLGTDGGER